jgi:hypothetical protein
MDGWRAHIKVDRDEPGTYTCLVNSVLAASGASQLEVGSVRCGSATSIDGTCSTNGGYAKFVETWDGTAHGYTCYQHGNFSLGEYHWYRATSVGRCYPLSAWACYRAYIDGTAYESYSVMAYAFPEDLYARAWGELTQTDQGSGCTSANVNAATFADIARYNYSTDTLTDVQAADRATAGCFDLSSFQPSYFSDTLN